jgi:tRNA(Ile)-lysidine synthase
MGPNPAVADVRRAVRASLSDLAPGDLVLVACSGGADSLALAAAVAFEARAAGWRAGGVVVDHGLQAGSANVARRAAEALRERNLDPVEVLRVDVDGPGGPESAARTARYAALDATATRLGAAAVLLAHTRDDQAETVLLGLARGSGARSLAGMPARSGRYRRPLLGLSRASTRAACAAEGLPAWEDPHNTDPVFARARVRHEVMPVLEKALGPGVTEALARTADLLRTDADVLDALAREASRGCVVEDGSGYDVRGLQTLEPAIRIRVIRDAARRAGCPGTDLFALHLSAIDALVVDWRGQRWVDLPGSIRAHRERGVLRFTPKPVAG